jgi:hypothetical protein
LEESFGNVPIEQALAVLGEYGRVSDGVIHVQAYKPRCNLWLPVIPFPFLSGMSSKMRRMASPDVLDGFGMEPPE